MAAGGKVMRLYDQIYNCIQNEPRRYETTDHGRRFEMNTKADRDHENEDVKKF
jgi:hypothetical protein